MLLQDDSLQTILETVKGPINFLFENGPKLEKKKEKEKKKNSQDLFSSVEWTNDAMQTRRKKSRTQASKHEQKIPKPKYGIRNQSQI